METKLKVTRDWDRDGYLVIENAKTLDRYLELTQKLYNHQHPEVFFAFDTETLKAGIAKYKPLLKEGEKIINFCNGGFATPNGLKMMQEFDRNIRQMIYKECDPQEVYFYEYNNYECCISYDGDTDAFKSIVRIFGAKRAKKVKRLNHKLTLEQILLGDIEVQGLTCNEGKTPTSIWFDETGKAFFYRSPVYKDGEHFTALEQSWCGMTARYKNNILYNWYKE